MRVSFRKGFSFGLTSAIITTLGMIVGLHSSTHSRMVVIGGIVAIAIADAFSDSLGMHISVESENNNSPKEIWEATIATFIAKFFFALTFIVPVFLLSLQTAIIVSVAYGLLLIVVFSVHLAKQQNQKIAPVVLEHLVIAIVVVVITHYVGGFIGTIGIV